MRIKLYKGESLAIEFADLAGECRNGLGMTIYNPEDEDVEFTTPWNENRENFVLDRHGVRHKWKKE